MSDLNRRDAARLAAVAAGVGLGFVAPNPSQAQADKPSAEPARLGVASTDPELEQAARSPQGFIMTELATTQLPARYAHHDLRITSVRPGPEGSTVHSRAQTLRVFRADPGVDDFTRGGGIHWEIGPPKDPFRGRTQLKAPPIQVMSGLLVMAIRDDANLVRWYSLEVDLRC